MVKDYLRDGYYLDLPENVIQIDLEQVLNVGFHKKDWGGEKNDLYTANVIIQSGRVSTAFMLKGNGLKKQVMEIRDCGHNGDQLVRLFESPAQLFIIQFIGEISENVIKDAQGKIENLRHKGNVAWFCVMNGLDTARVLLAYNKIKE